MNRLPDHIREKRIGKGLTQQQLAEKIFVTRQAVSRYETGERTPDLFTLQKLAEILDTTIDQLLDGHNMRQAAETSSVNHSSLSNNIAIILYSMILFSMMLLLLEGIPSFSFDFGTVIRIPLVFSECIVLFYGMIQCIRNDMTPGKTGIIYSLYFLLEAMQRSLVITENPVSLLPVICYLSGAFSCWEYMTKNNLSHYYPSCMILSSIFGCFSQIYLVFNLLFHADHLYSSLHTLSCLCTIMIHLLFLFQTLTTLRRRKQTS